ncbi:MAG: hypothetical protein K2Q34_06210 [Alphaproteobacteria bacterium]|nr:hypothetical protein [Alphaproteobacteria bacterium]
MARTFCGTNPNSPLEEKLNKLDGRVSVGCINNPIKEGLTLLHRTVAYLMPDSSLADVECVFSSPYIYPDNPANNRALTRDEFFAEASLALRYLLNQPRIDVNSKNLTCERDGFYQGDTVLLVLCRGDSLQRNLDVMSLLIEHNADLETRDKDGARPSLQHANSVD